MFMTTSNLTVVTPFSASPEADSATARPGQAAVVPAAMVAPAAVDDPVPGEVSGVIELFATQLAKVAFPEIDAGSLRRAADELRAEARAVARAREALDAALAGFAARRVALGEIAARAIAYARIYSQAHPDRTALATAIAALSETKPVAAAAAAGAATGKRRGRPPRGSAELFERSETGDGDPDGSAGGAGGRAPRGIDAPAEPPAAEPPAAEPT
jgi:hypothetical protein